MINSLPYIFAMKKHAILMICHNFPHIAETTIKILDNENIDFYIHVDKKSNFDDFSFLSSVPKKSNVFFIPRISVNWGAVSQIKVELNLLSEASKNSYNYYHLISGVDLPLICGEEFVSYFEDKDFEFIHFTSDEFAENSQFKVRYFYPFQDVPKLNKSEKIKNLCIAFQKLFGIKREFGKIALGSNWFSITDTLCCDLVSHKEEIFKKYRKTLCCDEVFLQTFVKYSKHFENVFTEYDEYVGQNLRYVDWKRGNPYVFSVNDIELLLESNAIFARKFALSDNDDPVDILAERVINKNYDQIQRKVR